MHAKGAVRLVFAILLLMTPLFLSAVKTEQREDLRDKLAIERWEYLVVANANRTNFSATGNPDMRKIESGSFGHEAFVLEQHLDRLGAQGWELVSVSGTPNDPIFYFKRSKRPRG